jgi:hypothetical protein
MVPQPKIEGLAIVSGDPVFDDYDVPLLRC